MERTDAVSIVKRARTAIRGVNDRTAGDVSASIPQAPGVLQVNIFDSNREAYFVATEVIPSGSTFQAFVTMPDQKMDWALEKLKFNYDMMPGESLTFPFIRTLGAFSQQGLTMYSVIVTTPDGKQTMAAADFSTPNYQGDYYYRTFADLQYFVPGIVSTREYTASDGSVMVEIKGRFLSNGGVKVVFEGLAVPASAVNQVDANTVVVNASKARAYDYQSDSYFVFDATTVRNYLLTVGQGGWSDTVPFRHTPMQ